MDIPTEPAALEEWLRQRESRVEGVRPSARSRVVWASGKSRTPCSLVYLHGFKASHREGDPVHFRVARELRCNLMLSRMRGHGLFRERPLRDFRPEHLLESARVAIECGLRLGDEVILMGTSTGASLALCLAGMEAYRGRVRALVLYSPLIEFAGITSVLLGNRFFRSLLSFVPGPSWLIRSPADTSRESEIWYSRYALRGALSLGEFIEKRMRPETFGRVTQPLFAGYWPGDRVASPAAVRRMARQAGGDSVHVRLRAYPEAGSHVICSGLLSGAVEPLTEDTLSFLRPLLAHSTAP